MFHVKIYVVQKPDGEVLAVKLTRATAQAVAKRHAPAKVTMVVADKEDPEVAGSVRSTGERQLAREADGIT